MTEVLISPINPNMNSRITEFEIIRRKKKKPNRTSEKSKDEGNSKTIDCMKAFGLAIHLAKSAVENKRVFPFHFLNKLRDLIGESITSVVQRSGNMTIVTPLVVPVRS